MVETLAAELLVEPRHERPQAKTALSPFDQAAAKPVFGTNEPRGSPEQFLAWARARYHPKMSSHVELPPYLDAAVQFVWKLGPAIVSERARRLAVFRSVAAKLAPMSVMMCKSMSPDAVHVAKAMALNIRRRADPSTTLADLGDAFYAPHFALWSADLDALQWPYTRLVRHLISGFPTVGDIPDSEVWRPCVRPADRTFAEFTSQSVAWIATCKRRVLSAARADPERARACWQRSLEEQSSGLILGPFSISELNKDPTSFPGLGYARWRPLPRFAIQQKGKWRCIDDGAASATNSSGTSTFETIVCDRPDSPLKIGLRFHELGPPPSHPQVRVAMGGGTDDKFAAYRTVVSMHPGYTTVMVARPPSDVCPDWSECIFRVPGHNFGLASAVLNFYHVAEPPTVFSQLFFGTPVTRYYDDHGVHEPSYACASGQECHVALHEELHFHFDHTKHAPWNRTVLYTGVLTDWSRDDLGVVTVGVSASRRASVRQIIAEALAQGVLSAASASSLRGKARFCICPVFGRVGLAAVQLLSQRQRRPDEEFIDREIADVLCFLDIVIARLPDFTIRFKKAPCLPPIVVLSDASWETNYSWLGFLVACPIHGARWAGCSTPSWLLELLQRHRQAGTYIGQLELAAAAAPYFSLPCEWLRHRYVMHYIDNQGACHNLINGYASSLDANRLVFVINMRLAMLQCDAWYDYVPSASNIADLPTRLDAAALARLNAIALCMPLCLPPEWCIDCSHTRLASLFNF